MAGESGGAGLEPLSRCKLAYCPVVVIRRARCGFFVPECAVRVDLTHSQGGRLVILQLAIFSCGMHGGHAVSLVLCTLHQSIHVRNSSPVVVGVHLFHPTPVSTRNTPPHVDLIAQ
jgi:hypothetical protein